MTDVFISYKRDERSMAKYITRKLQRLGLNVWYDEKIASGTTFDTEIEAALRDAKAVLVLWTPGSVASEWVRNEAMFARDAGKLVAAMLKPCELPVAFKSTQYEPIFKSRFSDDETGWVRSLERIKDLTQKRSDVEAAQKKAGTQLKAKRTAWWLGYTFIFLLATVAVLSIFSRLTKPPNPMPFSFYGIWPGDPLFDEFESYSFSASGTWELSTERVGEHISAKNNSVVIKCRSEWGHCIEAVAGLDRFFGGGVQTLTLYVEVRPIVEWNTNGILTRNTGNCFDYTMRIDRRTEAITALQTRPDNIADLPECDVPKSILAASAKRKEYRFVDGYNRNLEQRIALSSQTGTVFLSAIAAWLLYAAFRVIRVWRS